MKAIVLEGEAGEARFVTDRSEPALRSGYIGIKVIAVALNPADWKHIDRPFLNTKGCLGGCDYSGVVEKLGTGYFKSWAIGDRMCGFVHGGNMHEKKDGAFAEHIVAKADVQLRVPDFMTWEDAATLGVGVVTCGQGLFQQMGLEISRASHSEKETVLIYGGSSATGSLAIQFLRLSGYSPITVCSEKNFDFVKSLGAVAAFDYRDAECVEKIRKLEPNLKYAWDTIGQSSTAQLCSEVLSMGASYGSIVPVSFSRKDVQCTFSLGYTAFGERVTKGPADYLDTSRDFSFCKKWIEHVQNILEKRQLKTHPTQVGKGLENVLDGVDLLRQEKVSGFKLVYTL